MIVCDFQNKTDEWLLSHCGVDTETLTYIYNKYCGLHTIIDTHRKLYLLYSYFKLYPTIRTNNHCNISSHISTIKKHAKYLSTVIDEMSGVWNRRHDMNNRIPHHFQSMLTGSVDTFPIIVSRPTKKSVNTYLYNEKYKKHVLKVKNKYKHKLYYINFIR